MMIAKVSIDKVGFKKEYEYDNVVARDDLFHKILSEHKDLKDMYEDKQLKDNDLYITWVNPSSTDIKELPI